MGSQITCLWSATVLKFCDPKPLFDAQVRNRVPLYYVSRCGVPATTEGQPAPESWPSVAVKYIAHLANARLLDNSLVHSH